MCHVTSVDPLVKMFRNLQLIYYVVLESLLSTKWNCDRIKGFMVFIHSNTKVISTPQS